MERRVTGHQEAAGVRQGEQAGLCGEAQHGPRVGRTSVHRGGTAWLLVCCFGTSVQLDLRWGVGLELGRQEEDTPTG